MRIRSLLAVAMTLLTAGMPSIASGQGCSKRTFDMDQATLAVSLLCSPDPINREVAKEELIRLGPRSIAALLPLLENIYQESTADVYASTEDEQQQTDHLPDFPCKMFDSRTRLRVRQDAAEVLGRLRAVEAIPVLIKFIQQPNFIAITSWSMTIEMKALVRIGAPAVPQLIDAIDAAPAEAASIKVGEHLRLSEARKQYLCLRDLAEVEKKIVVVLGEIGDETALPILLKRLDPSRERSLLDLESDYVNEAINRIKVKIQTTGSGSPGRREPTLKSSLPPSS